MEPKRLRTYLDNPETAYDWMRSIQIADPALGIRNLISITACDPSLEIMGPLIDQLSPLLHYSADADMVLNNLERFFQATRSPKTLASLFLQDRMALPMLLEIFAASQYLGDMLINEPELFESIRVMDGKTQTRQQLTDELVEEIKALEKDSSVLRALRRFKRRQTLRIAFSDIIQKRPLEKVTQQISNVADALIEAAIVAAGRKLFQKRGTPHGDDGTPAHFAVLALGKLGGRELNYSSDIDLMFLFDRAGRTDGREWVENTQYFSELGQEIMRLLTTQTELGVVYRVDMRLRPNGRHGSLAISFDEALHYYDLRGRTWERQAFIKARAVAGNIQLGRDFLQRLQSWIYKHNLTQADIAGIRTLKRRIERHAQDAGTELLDVKTGYGGIRDIEFITQFLQLLHGGEDRDLRTGNTLDAIQQLARHGGLQSQEEDYLCEGYRFLRKIEHRLQIMFDLQTHTMPASAEGRRKLALRMGYHDMSLTTAEKAFARDFAFHTETNRRMLNHLLVHAFRDDEETAAEVDLLLEPEPDEERIREVLAKYRFADPQKVYRRLCELMDEKNPYLSARRCRHFLIAISPQLLSAISETPVPDQTLNTLAAVADALGAKAGLWELFSFNPPSLTLFVLLCAFAPLLTDMLCRDPGMLDGLMDSLVRNKLPMREQLDDYLTQLCVHAAQLEPILNGFKNDRLLRGGTRALLNRGIIKETTEAISNIAQVCLKQTVMFEYEKLTRKHGTPSLPPTAPPSTAPSNDERSPYSVVPDSFVPDPFVPCPFVIVGLGKFGGREMDFHSDLDLVFFFERDGLTRPVIQNENGAFQHWDLPAAQLCSNQEFFNTLAQNVVKRTTQFSAWGKLYEIDLRLRPGGKSGTLAVSQEAVEHYFYDGTGALWERQMLCKARIVYLCDCCCGPTPSSDFARSIMETIRDAQLGIPLGPAGVAEIRAMRKRLIDSSQEDQLKRGVGGTVDVEFIVQMLQLKYGRRRQYPQYLRRPRTPSCRRNSEHKRLSDATGRIPFPAFVGKPFVSDESAVVETTAHGHAGAAEIGLAAGPHRRRRRKSTHRKI